jgi:hypothetical protein
MFWIQDTIIIPLFLVWSLEICAVIWPDILPQIHINGPFTLFWSRIITIVRCVIGITLPTYATIGPLCAAIVGGTIAIFLIGMLGWELHSYRLLARTRGNIGL